MLGRFFKKDKLASADPKMRLQGVAELDDQTKIASIIASEPDLEVRKAAIAKSATKETLVDLLEDQSVSAVAAKQLGTLIRLPEDAPLLGNANVLSAFLDHHPNTPINAVAVHLQEPEQLANICIKARDEARTQLLAHDVLRTEPGLQILEKASRNRDKACNRHARLQLESIRNARSTTERTLERIAEIDGALRRLSDDSDSANRGARVSKLLSDREDTLSGFEQANAILESALSDHTKIEPPAPPTIEVVTSIETEPQTHNNDHAKFLDFEARLKNLDASEVIGEWQTLAPLFDYPSANSAERQTYTRLDELVAQTKAANEALAAFNPSLPTDIEADLNQAQKTRSSWLKAWRSLEKRVTWPGTIKPSAKLETLSAQAAEFEAELESIANRQASARTELDQALSALEAALDDNQYKDGVKHIKGVRKLVERLPATKEKQEYERKLANLSARLNDLRDWQKFATLPKRQTLIADLKSLAEAPKEAPAQASELRHLRAQWQALGPATSSDERQLQEDFDQLAEEAYKPCADYYSEQDKVRTNNLNSRIKLCEQLSRYLDDTDWSCADYAAAEQIMRTARDEWRKYHPCERKALKPVEQQFESLQTRLHEKVKSEWDRNVALKEAIIAKAEALLELEDGASQTEGAKALQNEWKTIGRVPRSIDQRLWKSFRNICDQIFAQRKAAYEAAREEQDREIAQLKQLLSALEETVNAENLDQNAYREQSSAIDDFLANFKSPKSLLSQLDSIRKQYRQRLQDAQSLARTQEIEQLLAWDAEFNRAELDGASPEIPHPFFASRSKDDDGVHKLLLELEIAADLPSPAADQTARMTLQVEMMNQGVRNTGGADPMHFLERWCALIKPDDASLQERFEKGLKAL